MILTRPVWELRSIYQNPAEVLMLVDRSTSMSLVSGDQNRLGQLKDILSSGWLSDLGRRYALRWFGFSDSLGSPAVSPHEIEAQSPVGVGTNLARAWTEALAKLGPELPTAAIIISDGAHNDGPDPARLAHSLRIPVLSIGIGSPKPSRDLMLLVVNVNPVVYRGSRVPVEVAYRAVGVPGQSAELSIIGSDGKAAAQKQVVFKSDFDEGTVTFDLEVSSAGRLRFTARISSASGLM